MTYGYENAVLAGQVKQKLLRDAAKPQSELRRLVCQANMLDRLVEFEGNFQARAGWEMGMMESGKYLGGAEDEKRREPTSVTPAKSPSYPRQPILPSSSPPPPDELMQILSAVNQTCIGNQMNSKLKKYTFRTISV